jgi:hypothetical protein
MAAQARERLGSSPVMIDRIDHLALTVADIDQTVDFHVRVLGMQPVTFGAAAARYGSAATSSTCTRRVASWSPRPAGRRQDRRTCA